MNLSSSNFFISNDDLRGVMSVRAEKRRGHEEVEEDGAGGGTEEV